MPSVTLSADWELFYGDDWLGPPWLTPEPVLLIHGAGESSAAWFAWVPRMAQQFRVLRPDLPGFGRSAVRDDFEWSVANLAAVVDQLLERLGIESAHIIGAKLGGAIAMQFAATYPERTRSLIVCSGPVNPPQLIQGSAARSSNWWRETQHQRLGSDASAELKDYWDTLMASADPRAQRGVLKAASALNLIPVLSSIACPTLVITTDRSSLQPVESVLAYQRRIPNSRLLVLQSDAYHVAVAKADECVSNVLEFISETGRYRKER